MIPRFQTNVAFNLDKLEANIKAASKRYNLSSESEFDAMQKSDHPSADDAARLNRTLPVLNELLEKAVAGNDIREKSRAVRMFGLAGKVNKLIPNNSMGRPVLLKRMLNQKLDPAKNKFINAMVPHLPKSCLDDELSDDEDIVDELRKVKFSSSLVSTPKNFSSEPEPMDEVDSLIDTIEQLLPLAGSDMDARQGLAEVSTSLISALKNMEKKDPSKSEFYKNLLFNLTGDRNFMQNSNDAGQKKKMNPSSSGIRIRRSDANIAKHKQDADSTSAQEEYDAAYARSLQEQEYTDSSFLDTFSSGIFNSHAEATEATDNVTKKIVQSEFEKLYEQGKISLGRIKDDKGIYNIDDSLSKEIEENSMSYFLSLEGLDLSDKSTEIFRKSIKKWIENFSSSNIISDIKGKKKS